jgi:hypothetical protein
MAEYTSRCCCPFVAASGGVGGALILPLESFKIETSGGEEESLNRSRSPAKPLPLRLEFGDCVDGVVFIIVDDLRRSVYGVAGREFLLSLLRRTTRLMDVLETEAPAAVSALMTTTPPLFLILADAVERKR